ncbi:hypothetical protein VE00_09201 [Pseudogymnoascus sp. WSF 3629]|nr:hypothetical protein VE00_09201 [Pseudogymnoascus sp. WSF 3629]
MSPSSSQSLPAGKDPPAGTSTANPVASPVTSPRLPYASIQPSQLAQEPQQESIMAPRPAFTPFFTLVDDATSGSTHHPVNVRYIFSDDDQDLTDEYLAAISSAPSPHSSSHIAHSSESSSFTSSSRHQQQRIPSGAEPREPEHRTLLLDLDASGTAVTSFHSLSPSWQLLSASITKAPTWESGPTAADDGEDEGAARFMLRLEGTRGRDEGMRERVGRVWREAGEGVRAEDFQVLVEEFERKMRVLRRVVETGGEGLGLDGGEVEVEDGREGEGGHEQQHEEEGGGEKDGPGE